MGLDIMDCRTGDHSAGVAVLHVEDGAPARHAGIEPGDIVIAMEGQRLAGADDFICRVIGLSPGERVRLTVLHNGDLRSPVVTLGLWPLNIPKGSHSCPMGVSSLASEHSTS